MRRLRNSVSLANKIWGSWGWLESHVSRAWFIYVAITTVPGILGAVFAVMSEWPPAAVYLTVLGSVALGAVLSGGIRLWAGGINVTQNVNVQQAATPSLMEHPGVAVVSEGVRWVHEWGHRARPECNEHQVRLLYRQIKYDSGRAYEGDVEELGEYNDITGKQIYQGSSGTLFCPYNDDGHRIFVPHSRLYREAYNRAWALIEAERRKAEGPSDDDK